MRQAAIDGIHARIESEVTLILRPRAGLQPALAGQPLRVQAVLQAYPGMGVRVRLIVDTATGAAQRVLSKKRRIDHDPHSGVADERKGTIGEHAFARLWERAADAALNLRFKQPTAPDGCACDIDLLKRRRGLPSGPPRADAVAADALRNAPHFALAGAEMPTNLRCPAPFPPP